MRLFNTLDSLCILEDRQEVISSQHSRELIRKYLPELPLSEQAEISCDNGRTFIVGNRYYNGEDTVYVVGVLDSPKSELAVIDANDVIKIVPKNRLNP